MSVNSFALEWRRLMEVPPAEKERLESLPMEELWLEIKEMRNGAEEPMFPNVVKLADAVMCMPHANADSERVFTIVTDVRNKKRNRMGGECLNAICVTRTAWSARGVNCASFEVTPEHVKKHTSAMYQRNDM